MDIARQRPILRNGRHRSIRHIVEVGNISDGFLGLSGRLRRGSWCWLGGDCYASGTRGPRRALQAAANHGQHD
ncbi:MAG: hypothetical protein C5B50_10645 [Verrucomicrobia bacterium]|nr:MAG: hypothetical protein C5B50_10645 [Verrucomicrobiota bacterium]